jgi:hypothetical protein
MNSIKLLSELSKFSADMRLADSEVYFDTITVQKNQIILDNRGDQPSITVGDAIELLSKQTSPKSIWIITNCNKVPAAYIRSADYEGEPYIQFYDGA